jgi:hypothetical protein
LLSHRENDWLPFTLSYSEIQKYMDIDKALRDARLDLRLSREDAPNSWYGVMQFEAESLCAQLEEPSYFTFNSEARLQAYAVYDAHLVVVTAGLFDFLCRLVGRIVASGLFSTIGQPLTERTWNPDPLRSEQLPRELLRDEPFNVVSPPWTEDSQRAGLFFYLLLTMFRFVVLHEIGHLYHRHGDRLGGVRVGMDIDTVQPRLLREDCALNSQARELVADKFAMHLLLELQEVELERIARTELIAPLGEKLLNTAQKRVAFLLNAVYVYFSATDRIPNASPMDALRMSHPPAAFRYMTIAATALESTTSRIGEEAARKAVLAGGVGGDALLAIALNRKPDPAWITRMQDRSFSEHYGKLYERVDGWTRKT